MKPLSHLKPLSHDRCVGDRMHSSHYVYCIHCHIDTRCPRLHTHPPSCTLHPYCTAHTIPILAVPLEHPATGLPLLDKQLPSSSELWPLPRFTLPDLAPLGFCQTKHPCLCRPSWLTSCPLTWGRQTAGGGSRQAESVQSATRAHNGHTHAQRHTRTHTHTHTHAQSQMWPGPGLPPTSGAPCHPHPSS